MAQSKSSRRQRIKFRIRKIVSGTPERPRMSVFRSNKQIYVQLIDDINRITLASASSADKNLAGVVEGKSGVDVAKEVGKLIAQNAKDKGIESVVFDRNGYLYHGRVKSLAESARESGLKF